MKARGVPLPPRPKDTSSILCRSSIYPAVERGTNISHKNHNGNRPVEHIPDPEHPILASPEPESHAKGPHDPKEINPKMASDIAYWSKEFGVTGQQLHAAIESHGTHVEKVRLALHPHKEAQPNKA